MNGKTFGAAVLAGAAALLVALKIKAGTSPGPPPGPPPAPDPGKATIYGKVTDIATGKPISGVTVSYWSTQTPTNDHGEYNIQNLEVGVSIDVAFSKDGYVTAAVNLIPVEGINTYNVALEPVAGPDPDPLQPISFSDIRAVMLPCGSSLWMTGDLYGTMRNPNDQAITRTLKWRWSYYMNANPSQVAGPFTLKTFQVSLDPGASQNFELTSNYIDPNDGITYCQFIIGYHQSVNLWVEDEDGHQSAVATLKRD